VTQTVGGLDLACATSRTLVTRAASVTVQLDVDDGTNSGSNTGTCTPSNNNCNVELLFAGGGSGILSINSPYTDIEIVAANAAVTIELASTDISAITACFLEEVTGADADWLLTQAVGRMTVTGDVRGQGQDGRTVLRCYNYVSHKVCVTAATLQ
jgi:hypothetical protein